LLANFRARWEESLAEAAIDYAVQRDRVADLYRLSGIGDAELAIALEIWPERPELPAPLRPDWPSKTSGFATE